MFDIEKCFDSLWVQECFNTLFENGLNNDKLVLLYEQSKNAQIAIKTPNGITNRKSIKNIIMQGTVFGTLICTSVMDKLAKVFYNDPNLTYMYKENVKVPVLGMVDDVVCVTKCSSSTVTTNATINSFMELNKLKLSAGKCSKIHVGKKCDQCPKVKVHEEKMKDSQQEKYLGDMISEKGTLQATIDNRISKAWSYVAEINAIINECPFGNKKVQVGLMLREAMFLNGVLHSSEVWHGATKAQIAQIEVIDNQLLRKILSAHAKTPVEYLYLETGALPVRSVIASRRLNYLKHLHNTPKHELIKRVFEAQRNDPQKGDWWNLVCSDMEEFKINEETLKVQGKLYIKEQVYNETFRQLKEKQKLHKKIDKIVYEKYETQSYLKSKEVSYAEATMLVRLRSHTVCDIKSNFSSFYGSDNLCPLCKSTEDTQQHCMECPKVSSATSTLNTHIEYDHIHGAISQQKEVASLYLDLLGQRDAQLQDSRPGTEQTLDLSTVIL